MPLKILPNRSRVFFWRILNYTKELITCNDYMCIKLLTSPSNSRNTVKTLSPRKRGWAVSLCRKTSCIATVFLNMAKYSLHTRKATKYIAINSRIPHASSSCFILLYSSLVIVDSPSLSLASLIRGSSKFGRGGGGGI